MGDTRSFVVYATNIFGSSIASNSVTIKLSDVPSQMSPPTLSLSGQTITTIWTAATNNGDSVTSYRILFLYSNGSYIENPSLCNGADSTVVSNLLCTTNMTLLTSSPVSLTAGT